MDTIERTARSTATSLPNLPLRLHHHAYVVKDHEANRRFIEDLLGIPLVATWCEKSHNSETGQETEFCHTFFGLADGSALAFFQFADPKMYDRTQAKVPAEIGRYDHIALKVDDPTYEAVEADHRAVDHHVPAQVEHQLRVFLGAAEPRRKRHAGGEAVLHILRQACEHRRREDAGCDRHDPHAVARQLARRRQGQADDAAFRGTVRRLPDLSLVSRDRRGQHDKTALAIAER